MTLLLEIFMTAISPALVKELREKTGAGMMDCKKALDETKGDLEAAVDWLRKKGLASAAKKAGRTAAEGLVAVATKGAKGAIIELNAETDFVARNEQFQQLVAAVAQYALESGEDVEKLKAHMCPVNKKPVQEVIASAIGTIGENMNLRRSATISVKQGVVASYIHGAVVPGMGKIGVLVALESSGDTSKLEALGKQIAMHIAAAKPEALNVADVNKDSLARERNVFKEQAMASGKPAEIADKMVEGRIRKYYEEVVLNEQLFVIDGKTKISQVVADTAKAIGADVKLAGFVHYVLGQGVEKEASDFAAEVAKAANG